MTGKDGPFDRKCMLCGSTDLHYEQGTTPFKTLEEASPHLAATQQANMETRRELDRRGLTFTKAPWQ